VKQDNHPRRDQKVKKNDLLLFALLAAGAATFMYAVIKRLKAAPAPSYNRPKGGERVGDFEAFIGS
jgi:hypothetical protein